MVCSGSLCLPLRSCDPLSHDESFRVSGHVGVGVTDGHSKLLPPMQEGMRGISDWEFSWTISTRETRWPCVFCFQSYDQLEPPSLPCRCLLSWFSKYYSLWIPGQPARPWWPPSDPAETRPAPPEALGGPAHEPRLVTQMCSFLSSWGELSSLSRFPWLERMRSGGQLTCRNSKRLQS